MTIGQSDKDLQSLELSITEKVEKRLADREKTRSQVLAIGTTIIGLLSAGIVKVLIDSAVVTSVDGKISKEIVSIESSRRIIEIEAILSRMESKDSVSSGDAVRAQNLFEQGYRSDVFVNDPSIPSILERYIDVMFALNRWSDVDDTCELYSKFCYGNDGIAFTILTLNGRRLLSIANVNDPIVSKYYRSFSEAYDSLKGGYRGVAMAYKLIWTFRSENSIRNSSVQQFLEPLSVMNEEERKGFCRGIEELRSEREMAKTPTPIERSIANTTNKFLKQFGTSIAQICQE